jgi:UDP:flavonoid glycosyltransferase YjiC (YdhE family)
VAHFERDLKVLRNAMTDFDPSVAYAEFRLSAIVAARLERRPVATGHSYPTRTAHAARPQLSRKLRRYLEKLGQPAITSALDIFDWADLRIVPSSPAIEPMPEKNVVFTGPFTSLPQTSESVVRPTRRDAVVVYMGNGTIVPRQQLDVLSRAFTNEQFSVCLASEQLPPGQVGPVEVAERFDFATLLPRAAVFINHGGQNSVMDGLIAGVPQLVCPGLVFERIYNARSIAELGAGQVLDHRSFVPATVARQVSELSSDSRYAERAAQAGRELLELGGVARAAAALEELAAVASV